MFKSKNDLVFSANSLQSFDDCQRRFELRYLQELKWPAVETEPVLESEQFLANGRRFHEMVHRDILGIPVPEPSLDKDPELFAWWENYLTHDPIPVQGEMYPEKTLVSTIKDRVLIATYDLIVLTESGEAIIYDWKTWRQPAKRSLEYVRSRLQSRVYPMLLVQVANTFRGVDAIAPEQIEMEVLVCRGSSKLGFVQIFF